MLSETNEGSVERPRAPGGMTGGVEFEAMQYFVRLSFRLSTPFDSSKIWNIDYSSEIHQLHGQMRRGSQYAKRT